MVTRRNLLLTLAAAFGGSLPALADAKYPAKPITIVVPFAAGGNLDVVARVVATRMAQTLGQPLIVDNRAGAGGLIGHEAGARAQPDGYTLTATANGSFAYAPRMQARKTFKATDFTAIGAIAVTPLVIEVPAASRFKTLADLLAFAKANPERVSVAHSGNGTTNHVAILRLQEAASVKFNIVAYKGSAPALTDLLGAQIDALVDQLPSSLNHIQGGKLRALAVATPKRAADLPNVPTVAELGFKGFDVSTTAGLLAPAKTPEAIVQTLNQALNEALADPAVRERLHQLGSEPQPGTPAQFRALLAQEESTAESLAKRGLLKPE